MSDIRENDPSSGEPGKRANQNDESEPENNSELPWSDEVEVTQEQQGDASGNAETLMSATSLALADPAFLSPSYPQELIREEEEIWQDIIRLRGDRSNYENRQALADNYSSLAFLYAELGSTEGTVQLVKKALEYREDPRLRHWLARAYGRQGNPRFVRLYQELMEESPSLPLLLEYCWFLEKRSLHTAALQILEDYLRKTKPDTDTVNSIDSFLSLLEASGALASQASTEDYLDIVRAELPSTYKDEIVIRRPETTNIVIGLALEEFDENIGLEDELVEAGKLFSEGLKYYFFHTIFITAVAAIFLSGLLGMPEEITKWAGTTVFLLSLTSIILTFIGVRKVRPGSEAQSSVASKALLVGPTAIFLMISGTILFNDSTRFMHSLTFGLAMFLVVVGSFVRISGYVYGIITKLKDTERAVAKLVSAKVYSRHIANFIWGSSRLFIYFVGFFLLVRFASQTPLLRVLALAELAFFLLTWRWGMLTTKSEKRRERDQLLAVIVVLFLLRIIGHAINGGSAIEIAEYFNFDAIVFLAVFYSHLTQLRPMPLLFSIAIFFVFSVLHFFPYYEPFLLPYLTESSSEAIATGILNTDLLLSLILLLSTVHNILINRQRIQVQEIDVSKKGRKPTRFEGITLLGLSLMLLSILVVILSAANRLNSLNLWLSVVAFLIILGFSLPFFLIFFGIISEETWLKAFRGIITKIPMLSWPDSETANTDDSNEDQSVDDKPEQLRQEDQNS